jgi:hypothetical protein
VKFSKLDFLLLLIFLLFLEGSSFFLAFEPFVIGVFTYKHFSWFDFKNVYSIFCGKNHRCLIL